MSITSETNRIQYSGDDGTTLFTVSFYFLADADLEVVLTVDSTSVDTIQTITTEYTVSGAGDLSGGSITMITAPATGETLTIRRKVAVTQSVDYVENDPFPADTHEQALDRLTMIAQEQAEEIGRTLKSPTSSAITDGDLTAAEIVADYYLKIDSAGTGFTTLSVALASVELNLGTTITPSDGQFIVGDGTDFVGESGGTARASLGLTIGTNVQAWDADLDTLSTAFATASASGAASLKFAEDTDNGANTVTLSGPASTADVTVTLPAATDTLVGKATTDTFTNKTFDANATGNSLSNIDVADLADGTDGELITWDSSGNAATVAVGSSSQILTSNGAGAAPTFQSAGAGGDNNNWTEVTATTASASASIIFTGLTGFDEYKFQFETIKAATDGVRMYMTVSIDNGVGYLSADYHWNARTGEASIGGGPEFRLTNNAQGNDTNEEMFAWLIFSRNVEGSEYPSYHGLNAHGTTTGYNTDAIHGFSVGAGTSDVDAVKFAYSAGNITSGTIRVFGR